jgi:hypothetical protein
MEIKGDDISKLETLTNNYFNKTKEIILKRLIDKIKEKTLKEIKVNDFYSLNKIYEKFIIAYDKEGFGGEIPENALTDLHPSKYCHEVIAKNVINSIIKDEK